jgi:hypothetical protein
MHGDNIYLKNFRKWIFSEFYYEMCSFSGFLDIASTERQ